MSLQQRGMLSKQGEEYVHFLYAEQDSNYLFSSLYFEEWDHFSPSRFAKKLSSKAQDKSKRVSLCISFKTVLLVLLFPVNNITYQLIKTLQPAISKLWLLQLFGCNLNAVLGDNKLQDGTRTLPRGWAKLHVCILLQEEVHSLSHEAPGPASHFRVSPLASVVLMLSGATHHLEDILM